MKPITLTMQAFGSYGNKTTIDFTKTTQNLFLVTGDTGAGKTTIFDAIVFALYGEASSVNNKKNGAELQSQYVDLNTEPFVELTFEELSSGEVMSYTVTRIPRHYRPGKRKGAKDQSISESVTLIMPDGREYPEKSVNAKLEEIVGLNKGQFMQVAMIAQGEFMELLRAKSDDKKVIFRKLFGTGLYQKIVDRLSEIRKAKNEELSKIGTACQTEASHVDIPADFEKYDELTALKKSLISSDKLNIAAMEEFLFLLKELCDFTGARYDSENIVYKQVLSAKDAALKALTEGRTLSASFEELEKASKTLDECVAGKAETDNMRRLIADITASYEVKTVFTRYEDQLEPIRSNEKTLKELKDKLPDISARAKKAAEEESEAQKEAQEKNNAYTVVSERVSKALSILKEIKDAEKEKATAEKAFEDAEKEKETADEALKNHGTQEQIWKNTVETLSDIPEKILIWENKKQNLEDLKSDYSDTEKKEAEIKKQDAHYSSLLMDYETAKAAFIRQDEEYRTKHTSFLDEQAGYLAKEKLLPGKPCPVCGSLEHPSPCILSDEHKELTRELIDELRAINTSLQTVMENASTAAEAEKKLLEENRKTLSHDHEKLREQIQKFLPDLSHELSISDSMKKLYEWEESFKSEGAGLSKQSMELEEARKNLKDAEEIKQNLENAVSEAVKKVSDSQAALAAKNQALDILLKQRTYESEEAAKEDLANAKSIKDNADITWQEAKNAAKELSDQKLSTLTSIGQIEEALPKQQEELKKRFSNYQEILKSKGFTEEFWKTVTEAHTKNEASELQKAVDEFEQKKTTAEITINTAKAAIGTRQKPDMEALEQAFSDSEQHFKEEQDKLNELFKIRSANDSAYEALAPQLLKRADTMKEFSRIDGLYNRLAGKVTGARMDIETFVQRYYLQRILYSANVRFQNMSAGQYELRMTSDDQAGEGKNRGLDLMVYSAVTGKIREVRTLSGGESFMAALSLALGMADQIQESSASINLDVMFIDEGFGSLDDHSRDQAIKVLQQMASGSKLIGIISHVSELKQEIEDQLLVTKDEHGSHVKWQIS